MEQHAEQRHRMREAAQAQVEKMSTAGGRLSDLGARVDALTEELNEVTRQYKEAWNDATKSGWSSAQLRAFGLKAPSAPRRRAPGRKSVKKASNSEASLSSEI